MTALINVELKARPAPQFTPAGDTAPARFIARLTIEALPAPVITFIYFDNDFSGAPLTAQEGPEAAALVYRALVAGSIRAALKVAARQLAAGKAQIKQRFKVDLERNLRGVQTLKQTAYLKAYAPMVQIVTR